MKATERACRAKPDCKKVLDYFQKRAYLFSERILDPFGRDIGVYAICLFFDLKILIRYGIPVAGKSDDNLTGTVLPETRIPDIWAFAVGVYRAPCFDY
jgi:hypothetical protein